MGYWSSYRCDNNLPVRSVRVSLCKCPRSIFRSGHRRLRRRDVKGSNGGPAVDSGPRAGGTACRMFRYRRRKLRTLHKFWSYKPNLIQPNPDIDTKQTGLTDFLIILVAFPFMRTYYGKDLNLTSFCNPISRDKYVYSWWYLINNTEC